MADHYLADLSDEWLPVDDSRAAELRTEVSRECPPGHPLHGAKVEPVAIRVFLKELICWLPNQQSWTWVHLTWAIETDPRWPATRIVDAWPALVEVLREADRG